jgi:hypothetical protein
MKLTKQWLNKHMDQNHFDWVNWAIVRKMNKKQRVQYAVYAAHAANAAIKEKIVAFGMKLLKKALNRDLAKTKAELAACRETMREYRREIQAREAERDALRNGLRLAASIALRGIEQAEINNYTLYKKLCDLIKPKPEKNDD